MRTSSNRSWLRVVTACLTIALLLPVPAFATLTFGTWSFTSNDTTPTVSPWTFSASPDNSDLTINPTTNTKQPNSVTVQLTGSVTWDGAVGSSPLVNMNFANFNALSLSSGSTNMDFTVAVAGATLGQVPDQPRSLGRVDSHFPGT